MVQEKLYELFLVTQCLEAPNNNNIESLKQAKQCCSLQ